jgi:hypothetical protein
MSRPRLPVGVASWILRKADLSSIQYCTVSHWEEKCCVCEFAGKNSVASTTSLRRKVLRMDSQWEEKCCDCEFAAKKSVASTNSQQSKNYPFGINETFRKRS